MDVSPRSSSNPAPLFRMWRRQYSAILDTISVIEDNVAALKEQKARIAPVMNKVVDWLDENSRNTEANGRKSKYRIL